jgi:hypothetical protein
MTSFIAAALLASAVMLPMNKVAVLQACPAPYL